MSLSRTDLSPPVVPSSEPRESSGAVRELAESCRRFVKTALSIELDYEPETLPILDHYLAQARSSVEERPETLALIAHCAGAYFGEVVCRRHPAWWDTESKDPLYWQVQFEPVYLAFSPVALMFEALGQGLSRAEAPTEPGEEGAPLPLVEEEPGAPMSQLELEDEDRPDVAARLAELPEVSEEEYFAPSTRLEVIDIVVEALRAKQLGAGQSSSCLTREDYAGFEVPDDAN